MHAARTREWTCEWTCLRDPWSGDNVLAACITASHAAPTTAIPPSGVAP